jgi:hypothetical protein
MEKKFNKQENRILIFVAFLTEVEVVHGRVIPAKEKRRNSKSSKKNHFATDIDCFLVKSFNSFFFVTTGPNHLFGVNWDIESTAWWSAMVVFRVIKVAKHIWNPCCRLSAETGS